jgi:hypothetical protein
MSRSKATGRLVAVGGLAVAIGLAFSSVLDAQNSPANVSSDGLRLEKKTRSTVVYLRPGANFGKYDKVAIIDCFVEFDKDWESNYNSQATPSSSVSANDMNRIKKELAQEFKKVFTKELQAGGYAVVDTAASDVLVVRPAIINLRVTAPDLMTPGINATVVSSAGSATLYLELWDSTTNTLLARAMDAQADQGFARGRVANRVTNTMAADFILKGWADKLVKYLQAARANTSG